MSAIVSGAVCADTESGMMKIKIDARMYFTRLLHMSNVMKMLAVSQDTASNEVGHSHNDLTARKGGLPLLIR